MKKVFITGAGGFIGKKLVERYLKEDYEIHGLFVNEEKSDERIICHYGDLTDFARMGEILEEINPNFIIHLAARTEVEKSFYDPVNFQTINYDGSVNLIEKAKSLPALELFVFASTMETYGAVPKEEWRPFDETTIQYPNAPYAVAKIGVEYYLRYAERAYQFPFVALRQTNTYGREDNDFFVVEQIITQMLKGDTCNLGYREPYRNFLHIDDLVDLYSLILKNVDLAKGEFFVLGPDNAVQISELAKMIAEKLNWHGKINWGTKPKRVGEIYYLNSKPDKVKRILNWEPKISLSDGLDKTIQVWKEKYAGEKTKVRAK